MMTFSNDDIIQILNGNRELLGIIRTKKMCESIIDNIFAIYQKYMLWSYDEFESAVNFVEDMYESRQTYLNTTHKGIFERMKEHKAEHGISFGEKLVKEVLDQEGYEYKRECYIGHSLEEGASIKLDFVVLFEEVLYVIEYNGIQHYEPVEKFGGQGQFEKQKSNDQKKKEFCEKYKIPLLEIPYTIRDTEQIREKINEFIKR